ncbi:ACT domain-containing protein [soil metagenome]
MPGSTDLSILLAGLAPVRRPGEFVFVTRPHDEVGAADDPLPLATVIEDEGTTLVVSRADADQRGWAYDFVAAWITLEVRSSLAAVGLTAAVSAALADAGISANVLAAFHHDHVLVPVDRADEALAALAGLAATAAVQASGE